MMDQGLTDLLITLSLTAGPETKHLEATLIMLVRVRGGGVWWRVCGLGVRARNLGRKSRSLSLCDID